MAGHYAVLSAGATRIATYRTLYFDTAGLEFFHDHRRDRRVRHKVRIRHYPDRGVSLLEVKTRSSELQTFKTWRERRYGESELSAGDQAFAAAAAGAGGEMLPQVWTEFRRLTLLGLAANERVTIDVDLGFESASRGHALRSVAVVEVKQWPYTRATPILTALRAAGRRPGWMSKYCTGIALTHTGVRLNRLLPGLRALERVAA
jgi:hypothetical protein